ncbi:MAG: hypothetical protein WD077_03960, partial [Bacteroidia bacterium]
MSDFYLAFPQGCKTPQKKAAPTAMSWGGLGKERTVWSSVADAYWAITTRLMTWRLLVAIRTK